MKSKVELLSEPELIFGDGIVTNCKVGLLSGPFSIRKETHKVKVIIGIVGPKHLVEKTKEWIVLCNAGIESIPHPSTNGGKATVNKNLFPDFPGTETACRSKFLIDDSYVQFISISEIADLDKRNNFKYLEDLLKLYEEKIVGILNSNELKPDIILCVVSDEMYDICHTVGDYHKKLKKKPLDILQLNLFQDIDSFPESGFLRDTSKPFYKDLRSSLKKIAMKPQIGIPIQILREATIDPNNVTTQNAATKAWNFSIGVFYKSGMLPWVLKDLDPKTCFLGISFYHKKDFYKDDVYTSMAHLFSKDFEGIILRGDKVNFDEVLKRPFLDYEKAKKLLESSLEEYRKVRKAYPQRLVIHKTSLFTEEETKGFKEILESANILYDLVTLTKPSLRLIRYGRYPVPRGTYLELKDDMHFLYTKGFVTELETYPGVHVPSPFLVRKVFGDTSLKEICKEIIALTKLNWNTADFCCGLPITVGFAQNVGKVLREFDEKEQFEPQKSYKFYM